jgi:starch-binding outer membrane protein, SusD/RagB family
MKAIKYLTVLTLLVFVTASCRKDLKPNYDLTTANVYSDFNNYKPVLAKLYAVYALSGQQGPAGNPDIAGIDEGFSNYLREYYNMQELTTDEAIIAWNDGTIHDLHNMNWTPGNEFIKAMYDRIFYEISLCNEYIRQTTDAKLSGNGIAGNNLTLAKQYRAEARFLRAMSYWHALDLFGNVPFVTENDVVGNTFPKRTTRAALFSYVESELKAIDGDLVTARQNEYGRADQAAAWMVLAKLYLNAQVYIGTAHNDDAITYTKKIIAAGYTLEPNYRNLFLADNNKSKEIIFPITADGLHTTGYGSMTYLVHAPVGGSENPSDFGINGGWGGIRTTKAFVSLFPDNSGNTDKRAMFYTSGQTLDINDQYSFTDGYAIAKYKNVTSTGAAGSDPTGNFPDTDFPMFRLADAYLMYAEAALRGGADGTNAAALANALIYVNLVRTRAYNGSITGNIIATQLTLPFILDERGRELQWEMHRRTDLIRFGQFTDGSYVWPWKGNVKAGTTVANFRNLMPIPQTDLINNPNLVQNPGY